MNSVRPKKSLGQHFLKDGSIAGQIVKSLTGHGNYKSVLEIGPGTGILTQFLLELAEIELWLCEKDDESVLFLLKKFPQVKDRLISDDFLKFDLGTINGKMAIIGNFPYNISSQILFRVLENRDRVCELVGMFQKEVAKRICSPPGSREYGVLSVFIQAFYSAEYLFTVNEEEFTPPPRVKSGVLRLKRNNTQKLNCDEGLFFRVVKTAFNQRRKTLRNALKSIAPSFDILLQPVFNKRAEQLGVDEFVWISCMFDEHKFGS